MGSLENELHSVATTLREADADRSALRRIFPEFSETQLSIAQLIIQGKRTSEICRLLDKSESNITAQRTHIRTKMASAPRKTCANPCSALSYRGGRQEIKQFRPRSLGI